MLNELMLKGAIELGREGLTAAPQASGCSEVQGKLDD